MKKTKKITNTKTTLTKASGNITIGIDYSIQCPCVCVHHRTDENWHFENCDFFYLTDKKKYVITKDQFHSEFHDDYNSNEERWYNIASWVVTDILGMFDPKEIASLTLEGYSYGSRVGQAFNIAENGGMLKHLLWKQGQKFDLLPPSTVKKFATGNGQASKLFMWESFFKETNFSLMKYLNTENPESNPLSDIVDAYYIAKIGF